MIYRLLQAAHLGDRHDVVSLTDLGVVAGRIARLGIRPRALELTRLPNPIKVARLVKIIAELRPDVVQTWMYHANLIGGLAAKMAGGPRIVWSIHNSTLDPATTHRTTRWIDALCSRLSSRIPGAIVSVSFASRDLRVRAGYDPRKFVIIPNGFDLTQHRPIGESRRRTRRDLGVDDASVLVGLVARVHPQKDHRNFVRAAGLLSKRRPEVRFLLCGGAGFAGGGDTSPANRELVGTIAQEGLLDRFFLLGQRDDVPAIMNALDIGTLSSSYGEAFPLVIGEAMACGVPCVVTDVGDSGYLVGNTGRVVPPRDPVALARAWEDLIDLGPSGRLRLGQTARARIEAHFGLRHVVAEYRALYRRLLGGGSELQAMGSVGGQSGSATAGAVRQRERGSSRTPNAIGRRSGDRRPMRDGAWLARPPGR
jgi:glycosyltransferase involved in cell wall biosynthesis